MKTVGGMRRSRYRGMERTQAWVYLVASSYNLLRMAKLGLAAPTYEAPRWGAVGTGVFRAKKRWKKRRKSETNPPKSIRRSLV